jgi:hypothetical protein
MEITTVEQVGAPVKNKQEESTMRVDNKSKTPGASELLLNEADGAACSNKNKDRRSKDAPVRRRSNNTTTESARRGRQQ